MQTNGVLRVAAVGDIHYTRTSHGALQSLFAEATELADVLVLPGDLTDYGLAEEAKVLAKDLTSSLKIPAIAVLGNHDCEAGEEKEIVRILSDAGVRILDGDTCEVHGVGFAGLLVLQVFEGDGGIHLGLPDDAGEAKPEDGSDETREHAADQ